MARGGGESEGEFEGEGDLKALTASPMVRSPLAMVLHWPASSCSPSRGERDSAPQAEGK